ncbi:hypothetical protein AB1L88_14135 [Tautonia sp. JC769]|uniref:hypothetical protein n=1 Tax=Tautonia sp. JC769 TaxID=3232135 RepID=UPI00345B3AEE
MRLRLQTMLLVVAIVALITSLVVQGLRAARRETSLRAELRAEQRENEIAEINLLELDAIREQEVAHLQAQVDRLQAQLASIGEDRDRRPTSTTQE